MNEIPMKEIRGAVARGWCAPANSHKEMDGDLAEAISNEVQRLLREPPDQTQVQETEAMGRAMRRSNQNLAMYERPR